MGYEIKLYAGKRDSDGWLWVHFMVELFKPGYESAIYNLHKIKEGEPSYFIESDGNTMVTKDRYDQPLKALGIDEVLAALRKDVSQEDGARFSKRIALDALQLLQHERPDAKVILFGH